MFTQMDAVCHRFEELSIRLNADGASVYTPGTNAGSANASAEIESLVDEGHQGLLMAWNPLP